MTLKKTRNLFKKYYNELKLLKGPGYFEAEETREFTVYHYSYIEILHISDCTSYEIKFFFIFTDMRTILKQIKGF